MRISYALLLMVASFGVGAAAVRVLHYHPPPPAQRPASTPAPAEGQRDSKADLQGQMMWDPNSGAYLGG